MGNGGQVSSEKHDQEIARREAAEESIGHAEKSRDKAEEIFSLLVSAVTDYAIFALDRRGYIQTWNLGAERIKGYKADEVIGKHFSIFYPEEDLKKGKPALELRIADYEGRYEEEGWRVRKDGSLFWANVTITALRGADGKLKGYAKVTRDLTAKKHTEEALRMSEERFRLMVEGVRDYAIFMLDPQGFITTWNEGARRSKGYEAKEIIGKHFSVFYPQSDLDAGKPQMELREAKLYGRFEDIGWRVRKDGSLFWANVIITAVYDKTGKHLGFSKMTQDLTERKKAEDDLRSSHENLELRVLDRTAELAAAKDQAEQALRSRDEFFSIASHELRTPLTSLKLRTQLIRRSLKNQGDLSAEGLRLQKYAADTEEQIDRLSRLVEDMLDLTRVTQGRLLMELQKIDLCTVLDKTVERIRLQFQQKDTPLEFHKCEEAFILGDPLRIEQVVTNLLTNALRYAPGGLVRLEVLKEGGKIILTVQDHGPGISPEHHEHIFSRYKRLASSNHVAGLGIGLYLARSIIEAHRGQIGVESLPGKGAKFVITLPETPEDSL